MHFHRAKNPLSWNFFERRQLYWTIVLVGEKYLSSMNTIVMRFTPYKVVPSHGKEHCRERKCQRQREKGKIQREFSNEHISMLSPKVLNLKNESCIKYKQNAILGKRLSIWNMNSRKMNSRNEVNQTYDTKCITIFVFVAILSLVVFA